ncbi:MAG: hypothetical protein VR69_13330 [Peptococcaceae bacterium BRH_c4b]|nr:MAG: hypothetical protein VR69_13330 [Peptococcaceae bacterium BRH_c4b]
MKKKVVKKILVMGMTLLFMVSPFMATAPALAAEKQAAGEVKPAPQAQTGVSLEKAIEIAKGKLDIPTGLDKFSSDYNEANGKGYWNLRWYSTKSPEGNFNVSVSSDSGEITNIDYYRSYTPGHYTGLPRYTREQSLEIAKKQAAKMLPEKFGQTVLSPPPPYEVTVFRDRDYPVEYNFNFTRTYSGIPVASQGINVAVNGENGEVVRFNSNWDDSLVLPSSQGSISEGKAREIFMDKGGFELTYFMPRLGDDPDQAGPLKLVYRPKPPGRFIIDAFSGELYDPREKYFMLDEYGGGGGDMGMKLSLSSVQKVMTPEENRAVQEMKGMLSADGAQKKAEAAVKVPDGFTLTAKNLDRKYDVPGLRLWRFSYEDKEKKNNMSIEVNAFNGELLSFNKNNYDEMEYYKEPQVKFSREQAERIALDTISRLQPGKAGQVILRDVDPEIGPWVKFSKSPLARSFWFNYARLVNGIVYPENGFRVRVDSTTGEVSSYDMSWLDTRFSGPEKVMDVQTINQKYLVEHPIKKTYSMMDSPWDRGGEDENKFYLVYYVPGGYDIMYDAATGTEIDYSGKPVIKKDKAFSDISGTPAEQDILLLASEGIVSGDGGKFRPGETVTVAELVAMLVKADKRGYYGDAPAAGEAWYKQYMDLALATGILEKGMSFNPEGGVNRLQMARLLINAKGYGKLARLPELFNLSVGDATSVPKDYRGYVAAVVGLGIMPAESGKFAPAKMVTRGEAATMLVRMLKL